MKLSSSIPVRFGTATVKRLKAVSTASGVPVAQLVRLATERYLRDIEKDKSITIPVAADRRNGKSRPQKS
ncbi:MAG: hypothetical protein ACREFR_06060 [Limisphaerales bacterium]